jgi:pimeloyl-ACP methyl ester carboxylesterase
MAEPVVRISQGFFEPEDTSEVSARRSEGRLPLEPALKDPHGFLHDYVSVDAGSHSTANANIWESLKAARQMDTLPGCSLSETSSPTWRELPADSQLLGSVGGVAINDLRALTGDSTSRAPDEAPSSRVRCRHPRHRMTPRWPPILKLAFFGLVAAAVVVTLAPARSATADPLPDPPTIAGFESRSADVGGGVTMHFWIGGKGKPVVLLHGWPETGYAWRRVAPRLVAAGYQVIVPDLRGFGNSSRPAEGYDRMTMAEDVRRLVRDGLHLWPVLLVGHDWGGSTAAAWASAHPDEVRRLVIIEAQPRGPWSRLEPWFYAFHRAPGLAEAMTAGRERTYLTWFYRNFAAQPDAITPAEIDVYMRSYGSPPGMRPGFELVRALPKDVEANTEAAKHPVDVPTLAIGGERGMGSAVADNLRPLFTDVRGKVIPGAGHFVPEEAPEALLDELVTFLGQP